MSGLLLDDLQANKFDDRVLTSLILKYFFYNVLGKLPRTAEPNIIVR